MGVAAGLNEYVRQSDMIFMANYAQTVNVIGCIKTTKTAAAFATTGLPLKLYRAQFGTIPVKVRAPKPLDVAAAWTPDRDALTIAIVNPTLKPRQIPLEVQGANAHRKRPEVADRGDRPKGVQRAGPTAPGPDRNRAAGETRGSQPADRRPLQRDALPA